MTMIAETINAAPEAMRDMLREMLDTPEGQQWAGEFFRYISDRHAAREMLIQLLATPDGVAWARELLAERYGDDGDGEGETE